MMKYANTVAVCATRTDDPQTFSVFWRSGMQKQGTVTIKVAVNTADAAVVAELVAMQHVIEDLEVLGNQPPLKGLLLIFGEPAIRKLQTGRSTKAHLRPYAYFLQSRFIGADIEISNDLSWIKPRAHANTSTVTISGPRGQTIQLDKLGKVEITMHAIEQFTKRLNNVEPNEAWRALVKYIMDAQYNRLPVSAEDADYQLKTHGAVGFRIVNLQTQWIFVLIPLSTGGHVLVTAYPASTPIRELSVA